MKLAVLGGSFNPVHIGHLILADCVSKQLGYDKIAFVPAYDPPHKYLSMEVSAQDRLKMVELATEDDERFFAEDFEINQKGVSYTWDTISYLEKKYSGLLSDKIGLIAGMDLIPDFHKWKNARLLAEKCRLIVAVRNEKETGYENAAKGEFAVKEKDFSLETFQFPFVTVDNPFFPLSSSQIRQRIHNDEAWRYLVGEKVFEYIKERNLYVHKKS